MRIVIAWPDWTVRADRCVMFSWLAEWAEQVSLITSKRLPDELTAQLHPACDVCYVDRSSRGASFFRAAGRVARGLIDNAENTNSRFVFQELNVARLVPQVRIGHWLPRSQYRSVLALYSPNPSNWRNRTWRTSREQRLSLGQEWAHIRITLMRLLVEMVSVRLVDSVVGNSDEVVRDAIEFYKKDRRFVHFYPGEIDTAYFQPLASRPDGIPIILFLGYFHTRKGIYDLLEAARLLRDQGFAFHLKMMGANLVETQEVQRAIAEKQLGEIVEVLPRQPRAVVREGLQTAALLALPSYTEGSPRVVKEAMACGCPVVVTDLPGTRFLDPAEQALKFVPVGDSGILAEVFSLLLSDKEQRRRMGRQGRALAEERFSAPHVARRMFELYLSLFEEQNVH